MADFSLYPGERIDDLLIQNLKIIQHEEQFCFTLDAVLLAHFASVRVGASAVDLGAGSGAISLLLLARGVASVTGVEISPEMAAMAQRSAALNNVAGRFSAIQADFRQLRGVLPAGVWDMVVANPPYRPRGGGLLSQSDRIARARHEITATLADVVAAARYLVRYRGRFAMVHLPERLAEVLRELSVAGLEPKRLQLVQPSAGKKPNLFLVESIRGARPGLDILPPLVVYQPNGTYTEDILRYYK